MIPRANITAWRATAPWPDNSQIEQDLVLSRALVTMYRHPLVAEQAAFRGGTALHKLFLDPPGRYSEDIELVQRDPGPIGRLIDAIREELDPWLGVPKWKEIVRCFREYMNFGQAAVSRAQFEESMARKLTDALFLADTYPLLRPGLGYAVKNAWDLVHGLLISSLPGDPWKGTKS